MNSFKGKKVAVLGLGIEGLSLASFLTKKGANVTVLDQKTEKDLNQEILNEARKLNSHPGVATTTIGSQNRRDSIASFQNDIKKEAGIVNFRLGKDYLKNLKDYEIIIRSPGIKRNLPEIIKAEKNGAIITSQTQIFFDFCPCSIIGVTGTKGKGTTSSLVYEMLKSQGKDAYLGGNIGQPPLDFLDKLSEQSVVVLELSSFQLQDLTKSPHIAVVLMITSEHLDYHKDTKEYVEAKRNILRFQTASDFAVINRDYPASNESAFHTGAKMFYVSRERDVNEGCFVKEGKIILSTGKGIGVAARMVNRQTSNVNDTSSDTENVKRETIIHAKDILLPGKHNWENVCAAVMAATLARVSKQNIVSVLKTFKGLEHRLELVGEIDGVRYYDDSFSTTPETAIAAIEAFKNPEILILGGSNKNSDFTKLGRVISEARNIKAIIGIGNEWKRIKEKCHPGVATTTIGSKNSGDSIASPQGYFPLRGGALQNDNKKSIKIIEGCKNMREVVVSAALEAEPGDVVILTPACASFDMFKNYKERGEQFKREVENLKKRASVDS